VPTGKGRGAIENIGYDPRLRIAREAGEKGECGSGTFSQREKKFFGKAAEAKNKKFSPPGARGGALRG